MKRRDFSLALASTAGALAGIPAAYAQATNFNEGSDFLALEKRAPVETAPGKVEVLEFFGYFCPHCNAFEPKLEAWTKVLPKDVVLRRVPVGFRPELAPQQSLFYTLEAMGKIEEMHKKVFYAIHVEKQALNNPANIGDWAQKQGLDRSKFDEVFKSFSVATKVRKANQLQDMYKVEGVPSLGIAGRFYTSGDLAQNMDRALQVTDYLIGQVRQGR